MVTALGPDARSTWAAMLSARSGVGPLRPAWARVLPVQIAAQVAGDPDGHADGDRVGRFLLAALREAWTDAGFCGPAPRVAGAAGLDPAVPGPSEACGRAREAAPRSAGSAPRPAPPSQSLARAHARCRASSTGPSCREVPPAARVAVSIGTGIGSGLAVLGNLAGPPSALSPAGLAAAPSALSLGNLAAVPPVLSLGGLAAQAACAVGAEAGAHAFGAACAASADAIAYGLRMVRGGRADLVAAGGAEAAIHPLTIAAFARTGALSRRNDEPARASRPFDKNRDGFVLGEGAAILVLEAAERAADRGAAVYCELAGAGEGADGWHITGPDPAGAGMAGALRAALADSGLAADDIVHVNAHATASVQGDLAESRALAAVLGHARCCVSATKSTTGHLLGAAGAVEAAAAALALRHGAAPPTANLDDPDDAVGLDVVRYEPRPLPGGPVAALSCSAGFGGHNVALAFRR